MAHAEILGDAFHQLKMDAVTKKRLFSGVFLSHIFTIVHKTVPPILYSFKKTVSFLFSQNSGKDKKIN